MRSRLVGLVPLTLLCLVAALAIIRVVNLPANEGTKPAEARNLRDAAVLEVVLLDLLTYERDGWRVLLRQFVLYP